MKGTIPPEFWPSHERLALMRAGMKDLTVWLYDIIRIGLIVHQLPDHDLNTMSSRLVDSQLGGLARKVRHLKDIDRNKITWPQETLAVLSRLFLAADYFKKWDSLSPQQQFSLLMYCGLSVRKDQLSMLSGTKDIWTVLGIHLLPEENLIMRRVWLAGRRSKKIGLILDFRHQTGEFTTFWEVNENYKGELIYYPSQFPLRAILKDHSMAGSDEVRFPAYAELDVFMDTYARAVSLDNWLSLFPAPFKNVYLDYVDGSFRLFDLHKKSLAVHMEKNVCWSLVGRSYCQPLQCFAEWNGTSLNILSYVVSKRLLSPGDLI